MRSVARLHVVKKERERQDSESFRKGMRSLKSRCCCKSTRSGVTDGSWWVLGKGTRVADDLDFAEN